MLGAIIGDIAGSRFEWNNIKSKEFDLLTYRCEPTDDSIMTLAVAKALLESKDDYRVLTDKTIKWMQTLGRKYPHAGYGGNFHKWLLSDSPKPYNSYGNGAAMRVSPCAYVASSMDEAKLLARIVTEVTHNHAEGIKGAEAVTVAIYMALHGSNLLEIQDYINANYYHITFKLDDIRPTYTFDVSCQGSVPQALEAFFESTDYEDTIRNAISIGGDSDTIAAIAGSVAEAYYGSPPRVSPIIFFPLSRTKHKPMKDVSKNTEALSREDIVLEAIKESDLADRTTEYWKKITSNALFNHLFEACNILRGPIDQDDYKSYVIPILFFKRISDVYDEETAENEEQYGDDIAFYPEEELHTFVIPKGCHWNDVRNTSEDVGKAIVDAMMGIEHANPDTMAGLFSSFDDANWTDKTKLDDERLKNLIEHMSSMPVGNKNYSADVMGDAYEYLIKKFADMSKKNAGEFYTPRSIVKLMVQLLNPKSGESVYDPACGTGGMLIEAIRNMDDEKASYGKIYGQEKNLSTSAIARMNLFLHGAKEFKIVREDTLRKPVFIHNGQLQQFDCVLANPPFGLDHWGAEIFENDQWGRNIWGSPTDSNADFAWLQHMYKSMRPGKGRCAVVMPQGVLFHGGREGDIRKKMRLRAHVWVGNSLCLP